MALFIFPLISARDLDIGLRVGFYNVIKTLAFASYFCKMRVKILYWLPTGELIFSEHFHSITDHIFHFKIRLWFSGLLNHTIDSDIKVLNHMLLTLASDHNQQKSKTFLQNFSPVELTYHKAGL